jgi:hypothetical protein
VVKHCSQLVVEDRLEGLVYHSDHFGAPPAVGAETEGWILKVNPRLTMVPAKHRKHRFGVPRWPNAGQTPAKRRSNPGQMPVKRRPNAGQMPVKRRLGRGGSLKRIGDWQLPSSEE